ncbi:MAG: Na+/H+ antiporter NhaC [Anaeromicrobium sp.]|jgi:NhaC family Na+:H+ antiporter|uniref:Na+/H+ antiporter NhaC n=1 Tax=Anaeromicrobium sp. TaxID=1929132 RepID=UPI0025FC7F66|nr:Na+/H+ antiporter NhaC [Anaeromicrobium sp.]MCT4593057.1 Na+/H+ antiporter NhaC [Anaeromicrobium sp.]
MTTNTKKQMTFYKALIPIIFLAVSLFWSLKYGTGYSQIPLVATSIVAALIAVKSGCKWEDLETGILNTIQVSMQALLILLIIGMIIGTWILAGVVPSMIYFGLKIISPKIFLLATLLICSIVSLACGSSWTTASTVGIALLGVAQGLEIPAPIAAGAIISGAYFGDKMSPLSETTNLAPAVAGSTLFDHIKHMVYTSGVSLILSATIFGIIGLKYGNSQINSESIQVILDGLSSQFTISPILFIPPIVVIFMVIKKVPAIPGLLAGVVLGGLFAVFYQGADLKSIVEAAHFGYTSNTGVEVIDSLLSRGGLDNMMFTVSLILCAMVLGGILETSGMLYAISEKILLLVHGTGSLVLATVLTAIGTNIITGDQSLSIIIPGRMYKNIYEEKGLKLKNLSRALEDAGTVTSPIVPWNVCAGFMASTLGVATIAYLPFAFFNLLSPVVSVIYGFTGITMEKCAKTELETKQ